MPPVEPVTTQTRSESPRSKVARLLGVTTILIARHGQSDWNHEKRWQGHADRPLTERGREQAQALADRLAHIELDAVYSSDLKRARDTAAAVAKSQGLELQQLPDLREVDVGSWSGLTRAEAEERFLKASRGGVTAIRAGRTARRTRR